MINLAIFNSSWHSPRQILVNMVRRVGMNYGGGEWAVVLPDIFEWRVLVIYRRRNRINRRREGKAKVDAV